MLDAFLERSFSTRWVSIPAHVVGCPLQRKRWFFLAMRGESKHTSFADRLDMHGVSACCPDARGRPQVRSPTECSGVNFNSGRPEPSCWLVPRKDYKSYVADRLRMLGNAVVPHQGAVAAQLLSTEWDCKHERLLNIHIFESSNCELI